MIIICTSLPPWKSVTGRTDGEIVTRTCWWQLLLVILEETFSPLPHNLPILNPANPSNPTDAANPADPNNPANHSNTDNQSNTASPCQSFQSFQSSPIPPLILCFFSFLVILAENILGNPSPLLTQVCTINFSHFYFFFFFLLFLLFFTFDTGLYDQLFSPSLCRCSRNAVIAVAGTEG